MSPYEAMFSNLVSYSLRPSDPFVEIKWDWKSGSYGIRLNHSEHTVPISDDEFTHSIANGQLEESALAKLVAELGGKAALQETYPTRAMNSDQ